MIKEEEIAKKCIELWGNKDQIRQCIEECSELITVLAKYGRNVNGSTDDDIVTEIADVEIMCKQMRLIFGEHRTSIEKQAKLEKLNTRVDRESQFKARELSFKSPLEYPKEG